MGDTVREKILQDIKTTLEGISIANGYNNNIASVQRWDQASNPLIDVPCIMIRGGPEEKEPSPNPLTTCRLMVFIDVWIRHDKDVDPRSTDAILNGLLGDVEKALMVDIKRGGYAVDTILQRNVPFENTEGESFAGIVIEAEVHYRHKVNDPEVAG